LERFARSLSHRGPDGEGYFLDKKICLGLAHRRLAILDLSEAARQPLQFGDGRYWITLNGEIYNFIELRKTLESAGYVFRTQSDTEVIPAAYDYWGPDCQLKFNGMWAFAIWDTLKQTLFVSRDRFGVKPLLYLLNADRFAFASEMKAFLHLEAFSAEENTDALRRVIRDPMSLEGTEDCLLKGLKRLPGGYCMHIRRDAVEVRRWWNTMDHLSDVPGSLAQQAERFQELFLDSCQLRLRSDVPVATCLSGGVDSSAVLCSLQHIQKKRGPDERCAPDWQRAFVACFPDTALDERHFAEIAVRHSGAMPRYRPMSPESVLDKINELIYSFEEVYNSLPAPAWAIYRELRNEGVVVSLDGHGADELLAGYNWYVDLALQNCGGIFKSPGRAFDLMRLSRSLYSKTGPMNRPSYLRLALTTYPTLWQAARRMKHALNPGHSWPTTQSEPLLLDRTIADRLGPVNSALYRDFHHTVLPTILRNFDRCSMAHGVEVRMPFMDWRLVCYVFSLPEDSKIGGGFTKRVLREAMRGIMPESLRTRRSKIGFNSPLPEWFNGALKEWLWRLVNEPGFLASDLWDGKALRQMLSEKRRSASWTWSESARFWTYVHAYVWRRNFIMTRNRAQ
jgi:asparagine synthase (glutamine-hydrolysing)